MTLPGVSACTRAASGASAERRIDHAQASARSRPRPDRRCPRPLRASPPPRRRSARRRSARRPRPGSAGDRHVVELVQHRPDRLHRGEIGRGEHHRAVGRVMRTIRPAATELRTKRTQCAAGRSPVNRPCPVTRVGSSTRRIERPTQLPLPFGRFRLDGHLPRRFAYFLYGGSCAAAASANDVSMTRSSVTLPFTMPFSLK